MSAASFAPLHATTRNPVNLAMQRLWLTGQVLPAGARLVVQHVFRSAEENVLEVIYCFPLPRDAALRSFRITGEGFEAHSELKETAAAVAAYEEGIRRGSLATLVRQYGDGLVNLTIGNIRPRETVTVHLEILCGVELRDDGFRFRFPFTLSPTYHALARCAATAPGEGEMELPAGQFGDMILPRFHEDASRLHQVGFELSIVSQLALDEIASPSHAVRVRQDGRRLARIALATEKDMPDRDLVFDVRFQSVEPQVLAGLDAGGKGRFAAIVPSSSFGPAKEIARRVVILLDRSGSMNGQPISQARKAIEACLGALSDTDRFGLVAFDDQTETFQPALVSGTRDWRKKAHDFLKKVDARGSTELVTGFREAAKLLDRDGGDILIFTDGQVSGTEQILADARQAGVRLHCLGIGSASQDRFLALLARETGGVSRFVTPRERVDLSAVDLFASMGRPLVSGLQAGANVEPQPPSFVFRGTPVLVFGETSGETSGEEQLKLTWTGGELNLPVRFNGNDVAQTVWLLQGSRLITDWESRYPSAAALEPLEKRKQNRISRRLVELSQTYGLASREVSLVAVVTRPSDRPGELPDTQAVPLGMAQDTLFGAYFGARLMARDPLPATMKLAASPGISLDFGDILSSFSADAEPSAILAKALPPEAETAEALLTIAATIESDGGMPGKDTESRAIASIVALLAFLSDGHTPANGAFRSHVARLVTFLEKLTGLSSQHQKIVAAVLKTARNGSAPPGNWIVLTVTPGKHWKDVEKAMLKL